MGLFSSIMNKIFHHKPKAAPAASPAAAPKPGPATQTGAAQPAPGPVPGSAPAAAPAAPVDVEEVLTDLAAAKGNPDLNWRTSIVDLLKLLDLDSSLSARKELAEELNVHAGDHGSAEQNIALQKAVMKKLAENGGKVPASLKD